MYLAFAILSHPHEHGPQVVDHQNQPRRFSRAEPGKPPLVFQFVEHVIGIGLFDAQIGDVDLYGFLRQLRAKARRMSMTGVALANECVVLGEPIKICNPKLDISYNRRD